MKNSVILKSFSNGISVILDGAVPYDDLLRDIADKFREADRFFQDAAVPISLEGRELTGTEEREILDIITQNSHLNILCLVGKDNGKSPEFFEAQNTPDFQRYENCGQFYKGTLKAGDSIEAEHSIIILGDVCPGSCVYSSKDIVILGALAGDAYAGAGGNRCHFIAALDMNPNFLQISDVVYQGSVRKNPKWGIKPRTTPKIAYVHRGGVQIEPITKELLDSFTL